MLGYVHRDPWLNQTVQTLASVSWPLCSPAPPLWQMQNIWICRARAFSLHFRTDYSFLTIKADSFSSWSCYIDLLRAFYSPDFYGNRKSSPGIWAGVCFKRMQIGTRLFLVVHVKNQPEPTHVQLPYVGSTGNPGGGTGSLKLLLHTEPSLADRLTLCTALSPSSMSWQRPLY